jgi:hypothetical protein
MVYLYLEKNTKENSLQKNINESFIEHLNISSGDASGRLNIYSVSNTGTDTYVRNTGNWLMRLNPIYSGLDLTGISLNLKNVPYNHTKQTAKGLQYNDGDKLIFPSNYNPAYGIEDQSCTLINPQYAIGVNHYALPLNSKIRFVTKNNQIIERTVVSGLLISDQGIINYNNSVIYTPATPYQLNEFSIFKFNNPINSNDGITHYSLMPKFYYKIDKRLTKGKFIYTTCVNGPQELFIKKFSGNTLFYKDKDIYTMFPGEIRPGASSHPAFTIINNKLIYMTSWSQGSVAPDYDGIGYSVFGDGVLSAISKAIEIMGNEYQITTADISAFNKFYPE